MDYKEVLEIANILVQSGLFPNAKNKEGAFAILEYGRELGIPPVVALQNISIVKGRLCLSAQLMLTLAIRNNVIYQIEKNDDHECIIKFTRIIRDKAVSYISRFTIEEAKKAQLIRQDSNWLKYPKDMLFHRCVSRGLRRVAPDIIMGALLPEEASEIKEIEAEEAVEEEKIEPLEKAPEALETKKGKVIEIPKEKEEEKPLETPLLLDGVAQEEEVEVIKEEEEEKKEEEEKEVGKEENLFESLKKEIDEIDTIDKLVDWVSNKRSIIDKMKPNERDEIKRYYQNKLIQLSE
ncbi:MAG: recombinase RecT [Candidatus Desulfofervidus auxilii]|nr:recombinase RecT [Candidatus Desulfofervidus auxilii]